MDGESTERRGQIAVAAIFPLLTSLLLWRHGRLANREERATS